MRRKWQLDAVLRASLVLLSAASFASCGKRIAGVEGTTIVAQPAPLEPDACSAPKTKGGPAFSRACRLASDSPKIKQHKRLQLSFLSDLQKEKARLIGLEQGSAQSEINALLLRAVSNEPDLENLSLDKRLVLSASIVEFLIELRGGLKEATQTGTLEREKLSAELSSLLNILKAGLPPEDALKMESKQSEFFSTVANSLPEVPAAITTTYQEGWFVASLPLQDAENDPASLRCVSMQGTACPSDVTWQNDVIRVPAHHVSGATLNFVFQLSDAFESRPVSFTLQLSPEVVELFSTQEIAGLTAEPQSAEVVRLRWNPSPAGSRVLLAHSTAAEPAARCELQTGTTVVEMAENATTFDVSGLSASSPVFARLCLSSSATPLLFSAGSVIQSQTLKANPSDVSLLNLTSLAPGSLSASWGELAASDVAVVTWAQLPTPAPACQASNGAQNAVLTGTSTLLSGLAEGAEYAVRHCVFRSGAALPLSSGVVAQARVRTALPPQPASLTGTVVSDTRLRFQWTSGGGFTSGFVLALTPGSVGSDTCSAAPELSHTLAAGTTEFEFENLNPNAQYTASLCALNSNTPAEKSSARFTTATTLKTLSSITLSPSNVSLTFPSTQAVTVTAHYTDASTEDVTAQSVFSLDDPIVGAVSNGVLTPVSTGSTTLRASFRGQEDTSSVEVSAHALTVGPLFPSHGANWLSFVQVSNPAAPLESADAACTAPAGNAYWNQDCLHAGELRTSTWTGLGSCEGLVASDSLNVFRWRCEDLGNNIRFVSLGFKKGKGLKDLVLATSWRQNALVVQKDGRTVASSSNAQWWTNPVVEATDNSTTSAQLLPTSGTIYTIASSRATKGYGIRVHGVALVTLPGVELRWANGSADNNFNSSCDTSSPTRMGMVCVGNTFGNSPSRIWLELTLNGLATDGFRVTNGLVGGATRTVVHGSRISNASDSGSSLNAGTFLVRDSSFVQNTLSGLQTTSNSSYLTLLDAEAHRNGQHGFAVGDSSPMQIIGVKSTNNTQDGITFGYGAGYWNSSHVNLFAAHNGGDGIHFENIYGELRGAHWTAVSNTGNGLRVDDAETESFILNATSLNNGTTGIHLSHWNYLLYLENSVAVGSGSVGVLHDNYEEIDEIYFNGRNVFSGNSSERCQLLKPGGILPFDANCMPAGTLVLTTAIDLLLQGLLGTDDPQNASDSGAPTPVGTISDWSNFSQGLRYWGPASADPFLSASQRGPCTENCRIYDLALASSESPLAFRGLTPSQDPFVPGDTCPANAHGDVARGIIREVSGDGIGNDNGICSSGEACSEQDNTLINAMEIVGDYIGNENGLCESNEACVYLPHQSSWAGEGDPLSQAQCLFQDGKVSGVKLFAAPQALP